MRSTRRITIGAGSRDTNVRRLGWRRHEDESLSYQDVLPDPGRSAFDIVSDIEMHSLIEEALGELNPAFRAAVVLRDIEDLSYEEISEVLQVSLGTVKSRILRGREALKRVLGRPDQAGSRSAVVARAGKVNR